MLDSVEPHDGAPLSFRKRLSRLAAIHAFAHQIDRARTAFRLLPIVLKRPAAPVLRFIDLMMRVQFCQGIATRGSQRNDLVAGLQSQGIVDLNRGDFRVQWKILRASVMYS